MSDERRKVLVLALLVVALIVIFGKQLPSLLGGLGGGSSAGSGRSRAAGPGGDLPDVVELQLSALEREPGRYSPGRDPFRFSAPPRPPQPPPPPPVVRQPEPTIDREALIERLRTQAANRTRGPQPPPVDVIYLGSFGPGSRPLAVFSDGNDIYNALEGGVVKEKFIVHQVGYESVDLGFVGFPDAPAERLPVGG